MGIRYFICANGCKVRRSFFIFRENDEGKYTYQKQRFCYCPNCGLMLPDTQKIIRNFFKSINCPKMLQKSVDLLIQSEPESAVRESVVVLEKRIKELSGLDNLHGKRLVSDALDFTYDKQTEKMMKRPLIAINSLKTESDFNEQEGLKLMLIGFFQGPRNLYVHNKIPTSIDISISLLVQVAFFLRMLDGCSMTKGGHWIKKSISHNEILTNMPNPVDRLIYKYSIWRRRLKHKTDEKRLQQ